MAAGPKAYAGNEVNGVVIVAIGEAVQTSLVLLKSGGR
jgi:hypothetical protein